MTSVVKIWNAALSHIGADARVVSVSPPDGSVEAGYCDTFYDIARTELLAMPQCTWQFALERSQLTLRATNPSEAWAFSYALPSDCLRPVRLIKQGYSLTVFNQDEMSFSPNDEFGAQFQVEGASIFTNEPLAVLVYVTDVTDTSRFTPGFRAALAYQLAGYLAGPIIKGNEGVRVGDAMRQIAMQRALAAASASANGATDTSEFAPGSIQARR